MVTKFDTRDYVLDVYSQTKFRHNSSRGFFSPYTRNIAYTLRVPMFTILFCGFWQSLAANTPARTFTLKTSNDAVPRKGVKRLKN